MAKKLISNDCRVENIYQLEGRGPVVMGVSFSLEYGV